MMARLLPSFGRLRRDRAGSSAVEIALMAPMLCAMMFGAMDIANGFAMKLSLEQAAGRAAELVIAPGTVSPTYTNLSTEVATAYGRPYSQLVVDNWLECDAARQIDFEGSCATGQRTARYVSISITAEYVPYFNFLGLLRGGGPNGGYLATGDAAVRVQ